MSALTVRGTQAVGPGVATTDDDDLLALRRDRRLAVGVEHFVALLDPVGPRQVFHRLVDAAELATRNRQVARFGRAPGQHDGIELGAQLGGRDVDADVDAGPEPSALGLHLGQPAVDVALLHLELGNAVAQQPADAVGALEDRDLVAGASQLLGGRQPGGTRSHHGDLLAGELGRRQRDDPAFVEGLVDDLDLDLLDGHRVLVDAEHARRLARCRAQPPGELGEVVGRVQAFDGIAPAVLVDQVVPLRNQVAQRTTVVAERNPAVHAAGGLGAQRVLGKVFVDFVPVVET